LQSGSNLELDALCVNGLIIRLEKDRISDERDV
jgi:hypothetical protein